MADKLCPRCGTEGKKVNQKTVKSLVEKKLKIVIPIKFV